MCWHHPTVQPRERLRLALEHPHVVLGHEHDRHDHLQRHETFGSRCCVSKPIPSPMSRVGGWGPSG
jgi:hypothetical protein